LYSSVPHFLGGVLHFLLGYSVFAVIGLNATLIAVFFALVFTAGHAIQEVQDHDADRRAGLRTNAVRFGRLPVFWAALAVFLVAYGYLLFLAAAGMIPTRLGLLAPVLCVLHLQCTRRALEAGLSHHGVRQFRRRYRTLFAAVGLGVMSTLIF
jgi:4-hydroxybenzoate polyprenyltransferase